MTVPDAVCPQCGEPTLGRPFCGRCGTEVTRHAGGSGSPRPGRSTRRWATYLVAAIVGVAAIGTVLGQSDGGSPAATDRAPDPSGDAIRQTPPPPIATVGPVTTMAPPPALAPTGATEVATLVRVVDGDTIRVLLDGTDTPLRYIGIDTPEPDDEDPAQRALADAATAANAALLDGHDLILERDVSETDGFGRILRYVWVDDGDDLTLINLELVRQGLARASSYPPDIARDDVFAAAQADARSLAIGLWASRPTTPPPPPATVTVVDTPILIGSDGRQRFEGGRGIATWSALAFGADRVTVRWIAAASADRDCRVEWRLEPTDHADISSTIRVDAGDDVSGNRRYDTPFRAAALEVESACARWAISMEGYETAPASTSGGGDCDESYPDLCVPRYPPDLDCSWVYDRGESHITVRGADPHGFDGNDDGVGCERP